MLPLQNECDFNLNSGGFVCVCTSTTEQWYWWERPETLLSWASLWANAGGMESGVLLPQEGRLQVPGSAEAGSSAGSSEELCWKGDEKLACWKDWGRPGCKRGIWPPYHHHFIDRAVFTAKISSCDCHYTSPSSCSHLHPILNLAGSTMKVSSNFVLMQWSL